MCKPDSGFLPDAEDEQFRFIANGCCTYYPDLPNFLVGAVLARVPDSGVRVPSTQSQDPVLDDGAEQARGVILSRIRARVRCTPFGIQPTASAEKIQTDPFVSVFGRDESFRCPFQRTVDGACTIWGQRNAVCSTWFCRFERGSVSSAAWAAVKQLLSEAEGCLASWCVRDLLDEEAVALLFDVAGKPCSDVLRRLSGGLEDDGVVPDNVAQRIWGTWFGREEDFFRACTERVSALSWADVQHIAGHRMVVLEQLASRALARLNRVDLPTRLRYAGLPGSAFQIRTATDGRAQVYSGGFDVQHFDHRLLERLSVFDGIADLDSVRQRLKSDGIALTDETLRRLVDYQLLDEGAEEPHPAGARSPVRPDHRLRVVRSGDFDSQVDFDPTGAALFKFSCGYKDVEFDEVDLLEFGRQLAQRRFGFTAGHCTGWSNGPEPLTWQRVAPLLDALIAEGVLEVIE